MTLAPLWKWPGGKRRYAHTILRELGALDAKTYVEPFVGAGGCLWALLDAGFAGKVSISDRCSPLMSAWACLTAEPVRLFEAVDALPKQPTEAQYLEVRSDFNRLIDSGAPPRFGLAARLIWLQGHGFNGLYRENRHGHNNVQFGGGLQAGPPNLTLEAYSEHSRALIVRLADVRVGDFASAIPADPSGAVIYCDPPYDAGFSGYSGAWTQVHREDLARYATICLARGARVGVSDRVTGDTLQAYAGATRRVSLVESHSIGAGQRKHKAECGLFIWEPK